MDKILVFGHQNPDTDTITSALVYANLLNKIGIEAEAVALGESREETLYALETFGFEVPRIVTTVANETSKVALVDHNEAQQSVSDLADVSIYSVVDHHRIANFQTAEPLYYRAEPVGCTQTILYKLYKEHGVEITDKFAGLMLSGIISDTLLFKSPTCTAEDIKVAKELEKIVDFNVEEYGLNLLKAGTNVDALSALEIADGDAKSFPMGDSNLRVGQINTVDVEDVLKRKDEILAVMKEQVVENTYDGFLLVITNILVNDSVALVVGQDEVVKTIAFAFEKEVQDDLIDLPGVVSRKKQVVPNLTKAFS